MFLIDPLVFVEIDCCGFVCVCVCLLLCFCMFTALTSTNNRYRQIRKTHSDYAWGMSPGSKRACVYLCVSVCVGGIKHTCSEDLLSTTHIPPLHNTGAVYRHKYNRKEPAGILQVFTPLLLPTVALACSKAAFDGGRIGLWVTCDGLTANVSQIKHKDS